MGCFSCFGCGQENNEEEASSNRGTPVPQTQAQPQKQENPKHKNSTESAPKEAATNANIAAQTFTFREIAAATKNFSPDCLLGEGGLGRVYKGCLEGSGQIVAVKKLDRNGLLGNNEFLVEVLVLSLLHHPNLVNLVGYCADGDQRFLVYEFMPRGSLENHVLDLSPEQKPLDWYTRMKIAFSVAQGLEYLHDKANPPVIYRDLKPSNILLDDLLTPKLSDYGLAKLGANGEKGHTPSMLMGTFGYCAPEYVRSGQLTPKSDVYSFGVVLLELITGRRAMDPMKPINEQNLVTWAQPMFKDQKRYPDLVDPRLRGDYPVKGLNQAVAVVAMCLQDEAAVRPLIADLVITLSFLIDGPPTPAPPAAEQPKSSDSSSSEDDCERAAETVRKSTSRKSSRRSSRSSSRCSSRDSRRSSTRRHESDDSASSSRQESECEHSDSDRGSSHGKSRSNSRHCHEESEHESE